MAPYQISFLDHAGGVVEQKIEWFEHDEHAIDTIGWSDHPHKIRLHQGERLVAEFQPLAGSPLR